MSGVHQLLIKLLYGTGLRLSEGLNLRVKDIDFAQQQIIIRAPKGNESRVTMLPESIAKELKIHVQSVKSLDQQDLQKGLKKNGMACTLISAECSQAINRLCECVRFIKFLLGIL